MKLRDILMDIHALEEDLLSFERKYGVRSDVFYAAYVSGEEAENDAWVLDFGEWGSVYKTWLTRLAEYRNEIQRQNREVPHIARSYSGRRMSTPFRSPVGWGEKNEPQRS